MEATEERFVVSLGLSKVVSIHEARSGTSIIVLAALGPGLVG